MMTEFHFLFDEVPKSHAFELGKLARLISLRLCLARWPCAAQADFPWCVWRTKSEVRVQGSVKDWQAHRAPRASFTFERGV